MMIRALITAAALCACSQASTQPAENRVVSGALAPAADKLTEIERNIGGRLGVILIDNEGKILLSRRANERFAMCSAFKLALAGTVLKAVDAGELRADKVLRFKKADLLFHSPVMTQRLSGEDGQTTTIDAAQAVVEISDNLAANLLLQEIGGPSSLTKRLRALGDSVTRLDRIEPELNQNLPGDVRDSSTPAAMALATRKLVFSKALSASSQKLLRQWTEASPTGLKRVRAGLPSTWAVGDKTGTCSQETGPHPQYNDIGWFITPDGSYYVFAVMLDHPNGGRAASEAAMASVGALVAQTVH